MQDASSPDRPLYLEDFTEGAVFETVERTVAQSDIDAFAELTGDRNPLHTDPEYCRATAYGVTIAHGLLVFGIFTGLFDELGILRGTALAFLGIDEWRFRTPVLVGDSVRGRITIAEVRRSRSDPTRGVVTRFCTIINQRGEVVQEGTTSVLVRSRQPAEG